jgi:hypothetical protein
MASQTDICNRALQKLGAKRIVSLSDDSPSARACITAYDTVRQAELRAHNWNFAISRQVLAADALAPEFGRAYSYTLPSGCLKIIDPYPEQNLNDRDWVIEGRKIYTNDVAPLNVRFISDITDTSLFDALFVESFAARMAVEMCEQLTQSNTKKDLLQKEYIQNIREARKASSIEKRPIEPATDTWLTVRL